MEKLVTNYLKEGDMQKHRRPPKGVKVLVFDIETAPTLGYVWGLWEQNVGLNQIKSNWYILCWAAKWLGEKGVMTSALPDFPLYKRDKENDREVVTALWKLLDEADVVVTQNGDSFDIKKSNSRFIQHGLLPPTPYKTVDTLKVAKKYFKFDSNKLEYLGTALGVGRKLETGGFELWKGCMAGDPKSWRQMVRYNIQDILLTEDVYFKMRPWMTNHPNFNLLIGSVYNCPNCASNRTQKRGYAHTRASTQQRYQCLDCGAWSQGSIKGTGVIK